MASPLNAAVSNSVIFKNQNMLDGPCQICLEETRPHTFVGHDIVSSVNDISKHVFHSNCIVQWFTINESCPLCTKKVSNALLYTDPIQYRFLTACKEGDKDKVLEILLNEQITQDPIDKGLLFASLNQQTDVAALILRKNACSEAGKKRIFFEAVRKELKKIVSIFLKHMEISDLLQAEEIARKYCNRDTLDIISLHLLFELGED